ncbi:MAG TPA: Lsr2 family protein [Cryptosporangiaceae bacterium]|nr:Lsr2 family protein [Cryptosporangiaceae bacterium]
MAKRTQTFLVDDIDGGEADETVTFSFDGVAYEIDLSKKNAAALRDAVAPYVGAARKGGRGGGARPAARRGGGGTASADREQNQAIREWAKRKGFKVSDRGRIPAEIVEKYHASS